MLETGIHRVEFPGNSRTSVEKLFCLLRMNFFKGARERAWASLSEVHFWYLFQVLLPLVDQYFTNHRLYFLSSPLKPLSSSGYASHKEKEMVAR